ncbi:MAG TPA: hypothetical protein PLP01_10005 [Phycisphaerae bacterium]|nr:hypothetical protein [Phycisphaerae bacterium]
MMRRRLVVGPLVVSLCWAWAGCGSGAPDRVDGMSYADRQKHFALNLLPSWERMPAKALPAGGKDAAMFVRGLPEGVGQATINVTVDTAPGTTGLSDYLRENQALFARRAVGYDELRAAVVDHPSGQKACLIDATFERIGRGDADTAAGAPGGPKKRFVQYAMLHGGKQYIITAMGPAADAQAQWLPEATAILDSLVVW